MEQDQEQQLATAASASERSDLINKVREQINVSNNNHALNSEAGNGSTTTTTSSLQIDKISMQTMPQSLLEMKEEDVPRPTSNGGFTHTSASRAKIGAANKGKTPWNKGRKRTEEEKARIAAGVRARNRERFLKKLEDMGVTEEEYAAQKREEKRKREAARRARLTAKGGLRPTEETKAKISRILKEKYAKGEIKPRKVDPSKVRRGFTHTAETRAKISASLRNRWANDPEYRARMLENNVSKPQSTKEDTKRKISASLKKKWQDPAFREEMMAKMTTRKSSRDYNESYREKISQAMKRKWQDQEYREKTLKSIARRSEEMRNNRSPTVRKKKQPRVKGEEFVMATPIHSSDGRPKKKKKVARRKTRADFSGDKKPKAPVKKKAPAKKKKKKKKKEPDGSVIRLREERRDLFELLYGDDPTHAANKLLDDEEDDEDGVDEELVGRPLSTRFGLDDEDLDSFDPYGLDDY